MSKLKWQELYDNEFREFLLKSPSDANSFEQGARFVMDNIKNHPKVVELLAKLKELEKMHVHPMGTYETHKVIAKKALKKFYETDD